MEDKNSFDANILYIKELEVIFSYEIRSIIPLSDKVIVLLSIPQNDQTINNIYAVNHTGKIIWEVQDNQLDRKLPYEHMILLDDKLTATDFYGRRSFINPSNGKIMKKDVVK